MSWILLIAFNFHKKNQCIHDVIITSFQFFSFAKGENSVAKGNNNYVVPRLRHKRQRSCFGLFCSAPVAQFSSRCDLNKMLFLVIFADAITHIRCALSVMTQWLKTDETYATFVKNDLTELEKLKEEKMKVYLIL